MDKGSLLILIQRQKKKILQVNRKIENLYKIRGTFIITGNDELEQDFDDLSEQLIKEYKRISNF